MATAGHSPVITLGWVVGGALLVLVLWRRAFALYAKRRRRGMVELREEEHLDEGEMRGDLSRSAEVNKGMVELKEGEHACRITGVQLASAPVATEVERAHEGDDACGSVDEGATRDAQSSSDEADAGHDAHADAEQSGGVRTGRKARRKAGGARKKSARGGRAWDKVASSTPSVQRPADLD